MFFQTLTLRDCTPDEVKTHAAALVKGFAKLRRKLPHHQGWARVIETKTADSNDEAENVHLHFVALFPPGQEENVRSIDWDSLWSECAGDLARGTDPDASFAREPAAVLAYMTKGFDWDYAQDGRTGAADPLRYIRRVENGHARFSGGGLLRLRPFTRLDRMTGLDLAYSPTELSTARNRARRPGSSTVVADIPIEGDEG
jgi:hypothetical protein